MQASAADSVLPVRKQRFMLDDKIDLRPKISVVTVFYNRANLVERSIGSLLDQTASSYEIIFVDDGSTDDTLSAIEAFADPRLRIIAKANSGFTSSLKLGIAAAKGKFIAIHGAGDISLPQRLEKQQAILEGNDAVGIVGCGYEFNGRRVGPSLDHAFETGKVLERLRIGNPFSHGEVMFRRSTYDQVGGYDEKFPYAQDFDLWLRMGRACNYAILADTLYIKIDPPNSVSQNVRKYYAQQKLAQLALESAERAAASDDALVEWLGDLEKRPTLGTKKHARRFFGKGIEAFYRGDVDGARFIWAMTWRERRDFRGATAFALANLCRFKAGEAVLRWVFLLKWRLFGRRYAPVAEQGNR